MFLTYFNKVFTKTKQVLQKTQHNNGINDFMTIDLGLRLVIIKLNGEKKIYYTKEFKVALELEYFLDGEVVANHCSDNDGKIDFIFDYSNERAINFFEEEL